MSETELLKELEEYLPEKNLDVKHGLTRDDYIILAKLITKVKPQCAMGLNSEQVIFVQKLHNMFDGAANIIGKSILGGFLVLLASIFGYGFWVWLRKGLESIRGIL